MEDDVEGDVDVDYAFDEAEDEGPAARFLSGGVLDLSSVVCFLRAS